jgi:hypothetical protein
MSIASIGSLSTLLSSGGVSGTSKSKSSDLLESLFSSKLSPKNVKKSSPKSDDAGSLADFGLGELESLARSAQAFQWEASQTSFSASGDNFEARGVKQSARFEATFQNENQLLKLTIQVERTVVGVAYQAAKDGSDPLADLFSKLFDDASSSTPSDNQEIPSSNDYSPASAADRLARFALDFANNSKDDDSNTSNSRPSSRDQLLKLVQNAIDDGFSNAQDQLGSVSAEVQKAIDQTRKLLEQNLRGFGPSNADPPENPPAFSPAGRSV